MANKRKVHVTSYFICSECGMEIPLPRVPGEMRKKGHIKDIYCPKCNKVTKFTEIGQHDFYKNMDGETLVSC